MTALGFLALASALILIVGLLSFSMMFQDVAPSQNTYWWPLLIPMGLLGLLISGVTTLVGWLA